MKGNKIYIIGNWKSNKNRQEVTSWFETVANKNTKINSDKIEAVVCPVFVHIQEAKNIRDKHNLALKIGAQDISPFPQGAYTGEVNAQQLKEYVEYVIIGHSERRKYFQETDEVLDQKVKMASDQELKTIFCVPDEKTHIPQNVSLIAYEPVWAIGTGKADSPENANTVIGKICERFPNTPVIYGGSVTPENIVSYLKEANISGVLPGGASLDPEKFCNMIEASEKI